MAVLGSPQVTPDVLAGVIQVISIDELYPYVEAYVGLGVAQLAPIELPGVAQVLSPSWL